MHVLHIMCIEHANSTACKFICTQICNCTYIIYRPVPYTYTHADSFVHIRINIIAYMYFIRTHMYDWTFANLGRSTNTYIVPTVTQPEEMLGVFNLGVPMTSGVFSCIIRLIKQEGIHLEVDPETPKYAHALYYGLLTYILRIHLHR